MNEPTDIYSLALAKASEIEFELKRLNRWDEAPLPKEKFDDMGAFGSNTMTFEQWLQFVLIPRIKEIAQEKGDFPRGSMVAAYAIRELDGDFDADKLHSILYEFDALFDDTMDETEEETIELPETSKDTIELGSETIPRVLFTLADILHQYDEEGLESELQTFDTFLSILSPVVRPAIGQLLLQAAGNSSNHACKLRLQNAAQSVIQGGRAAEPYDHDSAMKKYQDEHKKSFPFTDDK